MTTYPEDDARLKEPKTKMVMRHWLFIIGGGIVWAMSLFMAFSSGQIDVRRHTVVLHNGEVFSGVYYGGCSLFKGEQFCAHDTRNMLDGASITSNQVSIGPGPFCLANQYIWSARVTDEGGLSCVMDDRP
jgi:hypothetical protein